MYLIKQLDNHIPCKEILVGEGSEEYLIRRLDRMDDDKVINFYMTDTLPINTIINYIEEPDWKELCEQSIADSFDYESFTK